MPAKGPDKEQVNFRLEKPVKRWLESLAEPAKLSTYLTERFNVEFDKASRKARKAKR